MTHHIAFLVLAGLKAASITVSAEGGSSSSRLTTFLPGGVEWSATGRKVGHGEGSHAIANSSVTDAMKTSPASQ
jgi:hypothetical protein